MRLLHDSQNKVEVAAFQSVLTHSPECPAFGSCPGMGHHDEGVVGLCQAMKHLERRSYRVGHVETCQADASGWDFTVPRRLWLSEGSGYLKATINFRHAVV